VLLVSCSIKVAHYKFGQFMHVTLTIYDRSSFSVTVVFLHYYVLCSTYVHRVQYYIVKNKCIHNLFSYDYTCVITACDLAVRMDSALGSTDAKVLVRKWKSVETGLFSLKH
jgi:hypothetical protein